MSNSPTLKLKDFIPRNIDELPELPLDPVRIRRIERRRKLLKRQAEYIIETYDE